MDKDSRFRLVDKANSGYGASMNRGLSEARAEYIAILESDDYYEPDMLEKLYRVVRAYDAQVVKANCYNFWAGPPIVNKLNRLVPSTQTGKLINPQEEHQIFLMPPSIWSAIYRRDFLVDNSISFLETPGASYQDTSFAFKVWASATRVVFIPDAVLHYRQDNQSSSVNAVDKVYFVVDEFAEMQRYLDAREERGWLLDLKVKLKFNTYLWNYGRLAEQFKLEFIRYMSKELNEDIAASKLDKSLFSSAELFTLSLILEDPDKYHISRGSKGLDTWVWKVRQAYKVGGLIFLGKLVKAKLFG
jgi:glycosyltransferase involved in cell wall biosynthesis